MQEVLYRVRSSRLGFVGRFIVVARTMSTRSGILILAHFVFEGWEWVVWCRRQHTVTI